MYVGNKTMLLCYTVKKAQVSTSPQSTRLINQCYLQRLSSEWWSGKEWFGLKQISALVSEHPHRLSTDRISLDKSHFAPHYLNNDLCTSYWLVNRAIYEKVSAWWFLTVYELRILIAQTLAENKWWHQVQIVKGLNEKKIKGAITLW